MRWQVWGICACGCLVAFGCVEPLPESLSPAPDGAAPADTGGPPDGVIPADRGPEDMAGGESGLDAAHDARVDAAHDMGVDAAHDARVDAAHDMGVDAAPDARVDAAQDMGVDMAPDMRPPVAEICNGHDDDGDDRVDEALGLGLPCPTGEPGVCAMGGTTCTDGVPGCARAVEPSDEVCDGLDQDCDGIVDEHEAGAPLSQSCYPGPAGTEGIGRCAAGLAPCVEGAFGACIGALAPAEERCNGVDDDCDGRTDEGVRNVCGECGEAMLNACGGCAATPAEVCNGGDDDCDGMTDEGVTNICGLCGRDGINACGDCGPAPVETCNGEDDDCDGNTDERVLNECGLCGDEGINACGHCGRTPVEVCNGADDDCDGGTDEGLLNRCGACGAVPPDVCDGIDNDCDGRTDECVCVAMPPVEVCDGEDNDCDERIDEGLGSCSPQMVCNPFQLNGNAQDVLAPLQLLPYPTAQLILVEAHDPRGDPDYGYIFFPIEDLLLGGGESGSGEETVSGHVCALWPGELGGFNAQGSRFTPATPNINIPRVDFDGPGVEQEIHFATVTGYHPAGDPDVWFHGVFIPHLDQFGVTLGAADNNESFVDVTIYRMRLPRDFVRAVTCSRTFADTVECDLTSPGDRWAPSFERPIIAIRTVRSGPDSDEADDDVSFESSCEPIEGTDDWHCSASIDDHDDDGFDEGLMQVDFIMVYKKVRR